MGAIDIETLMAINEEIKKLNTKYTFKVDHGNFETAIEFWALGFYHPPKSKSWEECKHNQNEIICPDLLDYPNKLIIEYEEEGQKKRTGAKLPTKGHGRAGDQTNSRDTNRDKLYRIGGFKLLKIYESEYKDESYKKKYVINMYLDGINFNKWQMKYLMKNWTIKWVLESMFLGNNS